MTTDGQEPCLLVRLVLTSRKMVLLVPRPWHWCCYQHGQQVVLRQTLLLNHIECQHPSYSMWAHNPQFHRTETWLFHTFLFPRLILLIDLVGTSRVPYLVMFSPISDSMLMPDTLDPSFVIRLRHQMHACSLETSHTFFCLSRGIPLSLSSEEILCTPLLGQPRLINQVPIRPPLNFPPSLFISTMKTPKKG